MGSGIRKSQRKGVAQNLFFFLFPAEYTCNSRPFCSTRPVRRYKFGFSAESDSSSLCDAQFSVETHTEKGNGRKKKHANNGELKKKKKRPSSRETRLVLRSLVQLFAASTSPSLLRSPAFSSARTWLRSGNGTTRATYSGAVPDSKSAFLKASTW